MGIKSLLLVLILFIVNTVSSQSYPDDREKFVKVFQKKVSEYGSGDFQNFAKKELPALLLESSDFSDSYFSQMITTCNLLESKKFKVYPDIYNYVYSVAAFVKTKQTTENYKAWHESIDKQLSSRQSKKFTDFIEMSKNFLENRKIAESASFSWYYEGGEYEFKFEKKAFIHFSGGNLICRVESRKNKTNKEIDSVVVYNAIGIYTPSLKKWEGESGKVTWEKVGLDPSSSYAILSEFDVSLKKSTLKADTVILTTPYFSKPIKGMLGDRAFKINREEDRIYPSFLSFDKHLLINNIVPNVDYIGGFAMKGNRFLGAGTSNEPAQITMRHKGSKFIVAYSQLITVTPEKIFILKAKTTIHFSNGDSLFHPGLDFNYDLDNKSIQLSRTKIGVGQAPFQDSYHQLDVFVPKIVWKVGSDNLDYTYDFGTSRAQRVAKLESKSLFDVRLYDELQGYSSTHPLVALSNRAYKYDEKIMSEGTAATALGMTIDQAKSVLINLSNLGFITYDLDNKVVIINDKLETYVKAKSGLIDYDNLQFISDLREKKLSGYTDQQITEDAYLSAVQKNFDQINEERRLMKNFGVLDLSTMNLNLFAVDNIVISDVKNVVVFPGDKEVLIKKNRSFSFSGWMNAGKIEMDVTAGNFSYEENKIQLLETKKSLFRVRPLQKEDGIKSIAMVSDINGISGILLVDDVSNRSGEKKGFDNYPILTSATKTKIFYNSPHIYKGVYDSTRFYFTVNSFERDSLNGFDEKTFRLSGELVSAGIFPVIEEEIKIMPDYSFGFATTAPEGGYEFYGTEATFDNKIVLSNNGLQGAGTINFIYSKSISRALSFLPDSTVGIALFENKAHDVAVEFPAVAPEEAYITYIPKDKILKARSLPKKDLLLFDGSSKLNGTVIIQPQGMTGSGLIQFEMATLISDLYSFKRWDIDADTASFSLKNDNADVTESALSFRTDNVNTHISFKERKGEFNSNEGESVVEFPVNQYLCRMDKFTWFMDDYAIEMERQVDRDLAITTGVDLKGPNFYSTHPKQDSLQFRAPKARFNIKEKTILCEKVEYIDVADARIYPDSMKVVIRKKARIDKFLNAVVVADYITKYHRFEEAEVQVLARRDYFASGKYAYYDLDSTVSYILMDNIKPDTAYQTKASGVIDIGDVFKLSPEFDYYGNVSIKASTPLILFDGATRINHSCNKFDRNWMSFTSELDPMNIQIPVSEKMKDLEGNVLSAGIVWRDSPSVDSIELYPTFLSALISSKDPVLMTSSGYLQYNDAAKEFQIASKNKLIDRSEAGNFIALHTESCSMNGDGVIELGMDYGEVNVATVGVINYNQDTGETSMNITARFDLKLDKGLMQDVAKRINEIPGLKSMDFASTTIEQAILEWDGVTEAAEFKSKYVIDGSVKKVPSSLSKSITFSGIRLSSFSDDQQHRGLITSINSAVLVNIYGEPVMKYVPFNAFFQQTYSVSSADQFTFYINIPGGRDYFMHYTMQKKDGTLRIKTGDDELSAGVGALKEDKRKSKNFKYELTNNSVYLNKFLSLFQ